MARRVLNRDDDDDLANGDDSLDSLLDRIVEGSEDPSTLVDLCKRVLRRLAAQDIRYAAVQAMYAFEQTRLGMAYLSLGRGGSFLANMTKAIECFEAALGALNELGSLDNRVRPTWLDATIGLAEAYDRLPSGDRAAYVDRALGFLQDALEFLGPDARTAQWAQIQNDLGNVYVHRIRGDRADNIERAILHYRNALSACEMDTDDWARVQYALGTAFSARVIGDQVTNVEESVRSFEQALSVYTQLDDREHWAWVKMILGMALGDKWALTHHAADINAGIGHLEDALTVRTRARYPRDWALTTDSLARLYCERCNGVEDLDRAISLVEESIIIHDLALDPDLWAQNRTILARILQVREQVTGETNYEAQAEAFSAVLSVYRPDTWADEYVAVAPLYGEVLCHLGRWDEAADILIAALATSDDLFDETMTFSARQEALTFGAKVARWASYALARAGRAEDAVVVLERGRARVPGDLADRRATALESLRRSHPELYETYRDAAERLRRVQDIDNAEVDPDVIMSAATEGHRARLDLVAVMTRIRSIDGYADFLLPPGLSVVTAAAEPGRPVVFINYTPWGTATLVVARTSSDQVSVTALLANDFTTNDIRHIFYRPASPDPPFPYFGGHILRTLGKVSTRFPDGSSAISDAPWDVPGAVENTARDEGGDTRILGRRVLVGLVRELMNVGAVGVTLIPCGNLELLPLHAVKCADDPAEQCLLDIFDVSFAPSARMLVRAREHAQRAPRNAILAAVENPLPHPRPLAWAAHELSRITPLFQAADVLRGEEATAEAVLLAARGATHVHFACHGSYKVGENSAILELACGDRLSLSDIRRLRPFDGARLVVLSACQTAITGTGGPGDGSASLPAEIISCGAPGVIGALWPIDDLSTTLLMERFYTLHLSGDRRTGEGPLPPGKALGLAQRWLARVTAAELYEYFLRDEELQQAAADMAASGSRGAAAAIHAIRFGLDAPDNRPFADPYYWAPFVFVGA